MWWLWLGIGGVVACGKDGQSGVGDTGTSATDDTSTESVDTTAGTEPPGTTETVPNAPGGNVLLIMVDDVGLDKIGAYGMHPTPAHTPNMDALADQGIRFTEVYAGPTCSPSRASLLTGRHASRHGIGRWINPGEDPFDLQDSEITLAERVSSSAAGYGSVAVGKWHLVSWFREDPAAHPLTQGFERYTGSLGNPANAFQETEESKGYYYWEKSTDGELAWSTTYMTVDSTDEALDRMSTTAPPWVLYLAYNAAHAPLHDPPPELLRDPVPGGASELVQFNALVESLDTELGRLMANIPEDVLAETTVVFVGDNGTPEHGITAPLDSARGKGTMYEGGVRVPLIVTGPLVDCAGCTSDALVHVMDLFPTVTDIVGVSPGEIDGESILPYLADPSLPSQRDYLYSEEFYPPGEPPYDYHYRTLRDDDWKLVWLEEDGALTEQLYALVDGDLDEGEDLLPGGVTGEASEAYGRLRAELAELADELVFDR